MGITDRRKRVQATAALAGQSGAHMVAFVIPPGQTKHGPRRGGKRKLERVQAEIVALYPLRLPSEPVNINALCCAINRRLDKSKSGWITDPHTVKRAWQKLRDRNR